MNRREFLFATAAAAAAPSPADPFSSAQATAQAIRERKISAVELTRQCLRRIDRYNPALKAIVVRLDERALERAQQADAALAKKQSWGPLHGVPITIKESFAVSGTPATWGFAPLKDVRAKRDAVAVRRLLDAGAIIVGTTNVPVGLSDWQSYNPIYGTTNNPWDTKRTPGGSTGGGAAALAAGLGYLTLGSDIGGSIRVPAHFCGVYGHKPTLELVSLRGHGTGTNEDDIPFTVDLPVAGPLARWAGDLRIAIEAMGGPAGDDAKAWKWTLPAPRHRRLRDFRAGYVLNDPWCPLSSDVAPVLDGTLKAIEKAGVRLEPGWPPGIRPDEHLVTYLYLLGAFLFSRVPPQERARLQEQHRKNPADPLLAGAFEPHARWVEETSKRNVARAAWQRYFETHDAFLLPVAFAAAFPHDHSEPMEARKLRTPGGARPYMDMIRWVSLATLAGLPATVAPVGRTAEGLPVGLQILGPYWEDASPIEFAARLAEVTGGFQAPKGYS